MTDTQDSIPPAPIRLVQDFANTVDVEGGSDELGTLEGLRSFLERSGLVPPGTPLGDEDRARARDLRTAVRALLEANHGETPSARSISTLNLFARASALELRFDEDGGARLLACCSGPVDAAFGRILESIHAAMSDGSFERLKICKMDSCRWAFYDNSKNHSGQWCSMRVCGSRAKARAYRARKKAQTRR